MNYAPVLNLTGTVDNPEKPPEPVTEPSSESSDYACLIKLKKTETIIP